MKKNIAAFYDIDGTISREGLFTEIFKKMITHEFVDRSLWQNEVKPSYDKWSARYGDYNEYLDTMTAIYVKAIIGYRREHIFHIAKKTIEQTGDKVYSYARKTIEQHRNEGHRLILISGSPDEFVKEMADKYKFDDYIGTVYDVDENNAYTGKLAPMWTSEAKEKEIEIFRGKYNLDLQMSYAYGDTPGDFGMFKGVGYPTAVNPNKELLELIATNKNVKEKIKIAVERKNMVYDIPFSDIKLN